MIGLIVATHGNFASGIISSVNLIAGEQNDLIGVNFVEGQSSEELKQNLEKAISDISCDEILILTDLMGGTPFNISSTISTSTDNKKIKVVSGMNLPMLMEAVFSREQTDLDSLITVTKESAIDGISDLDTISKAENNVEELEGI